MVSDGGSDRSGESGCKITLQVLQALASLKRSSLEEDDPRRVIPLPKEAKQQIVKIVKGEALAKNAEARQRKQEKREKRREQVRSAPPVQKLKKVSSHNVRDKFCDLFTQQFPHEPFPSFYKKELTLSKQLLEHYGWKEVEAALEFFFEHWVEYKGTWYEGDAPTIGVFWGMRERVFSDARKGVVAKAAKSEKANIGEYPDPDEEDDPNKSTIGWD